MIQAEVAAPIQISGQVRSRIEAFGRPDFGLGATPSYVEVAARGTVGVEVRRDLWGLGAEISVAEQDGRPSARPFDESEPDLVQGFVRLGSERGASVKVGRQTLDLQNRLIALRDGVTLKRTFDGVRADVPLQGGRLTVFQVRPTRVRSGGFDDDATPGETFQGIDYARAGWSVFHFERRRDGPTPASARERRRTSGLTYRHRGPSSDLRATGGVQHGHVGGRDIRAWGFVVDGGWRPAANSTWRLGAEVGMASGDRDPGDRVAATFDPLYPNLGAYTEAPISDYRNQVNVQVNVTRTTPALTVKADVTLLSRLTDRDALYLPPGRPILAAGVPGRLSGLAAEIKAQWRLSPGLELQASVLGVEPLGGVERAGGRRSVFSIVQLTRTF